MKINKGNIFLLMSAIVWGLGLVSQQAGMEYLGPFSFTAVRCTLGGVSMLPLVWVLDRKKAPEVKAAEAPLKDTLKAAFFCSLALITVIISQQYGLLHTTVGKAGFITATYILMTPVSGIFLGKKVQKNIWVAVAVALVAMYILCLRDGFSGLNLGDMLMLVAAVAYTTHIHLIDGFVNRMDAVKLSCYQFIMVGLMSFLPAFILEGSTFTVQNILLSGIPILYAGIFSCAVGYTFQVLGQKFTDPNTASLLLSTETVFTLLAGWLILNEVMAPAEYLGCVIMFVAIIIAQLPQKSEK